MVKAPLVLTLGELATRADVTPRKIRYYIQNRLLRPPVGLGSTAHYSEVHVLQLELIRRLREQYRPLDEIRGYLAQLGEPELRKLVHIQPEKSPTSAIDFAKKMLHGRPSESAADYATGVLRGKPPSAEGAGAEVSPLVPALEDTKRARFPERRPGRRQTDPGDQTEWRRVTLTPDVEIHVRLPIREESLQLVNEIRALVMRLKKGDRK